MQRTLYRAGIGVVLIGTLLLVAHLTGWTRYFDVDEMRELVLSAGVWGMAVYVGVVALGHFLHVPGLALVAAGVLVWGRIGGGVLAYVASVVAVTFCFLLVRAIGGRPLAEVKQRHARRLLAHLEDRPIRTVALCRLATFFAPGMTYALALSNVRLRAYVAGCAIGLVVPIAIFAGLLGIFFNY